MKIHGREIGMRLTIGATLEIAKLTPHENIDEIGELIGNSTFAGQMNLIVKFIVAMSKGYESAKRFEDPTYTPNPLTEEEILSLDMQTLTALQEAAFAAYKGDSEVTVEVEEPKKEPAPPRSA